MVTALPHRSFPGRPGRQQGKAWAADRRTRQSPENRKRAVWAATMRESTTDAVPRFAPVEHEWAVEPTRGGLL